jgi:DNA repair protein RecO (recombination protein O)
VGYHKAEAVVLSRREFSETSLILTFLTQEAGLLRGIAKGARRPRGLFDAGLEPFARCTLVFLDRRSQGLALLTEATVRESFPGLRGSLDRMHAAWFAAELLSSLCEEGNPAPVLYGLLVEYLGTVAQAERTGALVLALALQVLAEEGYRPQLDRCVGCGAALGGPASRPRRLKVSARMGGTVCSGCESAGGRLVVVSPGGGAAMRNLLVAPLKAVAKMRLSLTIQKECFAAVGALLAEVLGAPLRTWPLVRPHV